MFAIAKKVGLRKNILTTICPLPTRLTEYFMTPLRILFALSLAGALFGCGGQYDIDPAMSLAATTAVASGAALTAAPAVTVPATPASVLASSTMPVPDCAPEDCAGLRIIDGNAEAWRIDAARRAERDADHS